MAESLVSGGLGRHCSLEKRKRRKAAEEADELSWGQAELPAGFPGLTQSEKTGHRVSGTQWGETMASEGVRVPGDRAKKT